MKTADLIIKGAYLVSMDQTRSVRTDACIVICGDTIAAVGGAELLEQYTAARVIDAGGRVVFPGLISTHSHLFQTMLKGLGRDKCLIDWLNSSIRVALHSFDEETIYHAALLGCIEAIHSGTTTLLDYQYCHAVPGLDEQVIRAFEDLGIRGVLGRGFSNVASFPRETACPLVETEQDFFDAVLRIEQQCRDKEKVSVCLAPGIIWDHTADGFLEIRRLANQLHMPITLHIVESKEDDAFSLKHYGRRAIPQLEHWGVLGPDFLAVHCVQMEEEDIAAFRRNDVKISYNPVSNMILASGAPPMARLVEEGLSISLACDGSASNDSQNMLEVLKSASLLQKAATCNPVVLPASSVLEMATLGGARALGRAHQLGSVEVGKKADLMIFRPGLFSLPVHDPVNALIYASTPANVETVLVGGVPVLENGALTNVDEERILWESQRLANRLAERAGLGSIQWGQQMPQFLSKKGVSL